MRRTSPYDSRRRSPQVKSYRPTVENLEDRLPPGDVLLGPGLAGSWLAQSVAMSRAESGMGMNSQTELRVTENQPTQFISRPMPQPNRTASTPIFVAGFTASDAPADQSVSNTARIDTIKPAYGEASGLDDNQLDQLLGDDFDSLSGSAKTRSPATSHLTGGFEKPLAAEPQGGSANGGAARSLGDAAGPSGPVTPNVASGASSTPIFPGGSHGGIHPFTASALPTDAPPTNDASGGSGQSGGPIVSSSGGSTSGGGPTLSSGGGPTSSGGGPTSSGGGPTSSGGGPTSSGGGPTSSGGCDCGCSSASGGGNSGGSDVIGSASGAYDSSIDSSSTFSQAGVRYMDGEVKMSTTDLSSSAMGTTWGQTRSWTNMFTPDSFNGSGMIDAQQPFLMQKTAGSDSTIIVVSSDANARYFDLSGGVYTPHFFVQDKLTHPTGEFVLATTTGQQIHFFDFTASQVNQRGQFKSLVDAKGNTVSVTSWTADGKPAEMQRTDSSSGVTESYVDTYLTAPDPNAGLLANETLRRQVNGGPWTVVRQVAYDYYDGTSQKPYGNLGDLRTATTLDGNNNVLDIQYTRYYTPTDAGSIGYVHGMKYSFSPQSYARLAASVGNPLTATDAQVAPYADNYFEWDPTTQRVTKETRQGNGCSVCTGGLGTFTYTYTLSTNPQGLNSWACKTVETLPDGSTNTVYTNYATEVMLDVFQNGGQKWETFYQYDSAGKLVLKANPSAVTGYNDAYADLLDQNQVGDYGYLSSNTGLIELTDYYTSTTATETTAGGVAGYYQDTKLEQGKSGTPILQKTVQYFAHTGGSSTVYPMATSTVYRNTNGTGAETTSYSYTWYTGTTQEQSMTVSLPVIPTGEHGTGSADIWTYSYDVYARVVQSTDPDGYVNTYQYDSATGAQIQSVIDSGTGHLNLTTTTVVDGLGRPTKVIDPNGNVTYTVYNDPNHEVRAYPGWTGTTTTGPTQVTREDRAHDPSYAETFTMSAAPHVTNGQPDGTEAYAFLQALSRTITSKGGQVAETDNYFNLGGVPYSTSVYLGTAGTNYYATLYTYDNPRGWLSRVLSPTGTINRTVYDPLGRVVSTWIGTNDTPASGSWSPTNNTAPSNMVQVTANVWDGGAVGDSTLTQVTQYPGGSAPARVTQNYFDWRDRLVASKQGVQANENDGTGRPIFYSVYDNLSEITTSQRYNGDGVTITSTGGVPNAPSASLLQAQTGTAYDDQGRVYVSSVSWVQQGTVATNSLQTGTWYNHRGFAVKVAPPGAAVTKTAYDGAGRPTVVYTTDSQNDNPWSVGTFDDVLTQTATTYDNDGNALLVTRRDHFDTDSVNGPLGTPTTAPYARVSYVTNYYDAANRLTASVNVGTNGGAAYTRPATVPARSDTVLVTSTGYQADAVQQVMETGSPTGGGFRLLFGGQTSVFIAYNATASTVQSAVQGLSSIGANNALVSGPAGGPWQIRFAGALAGTPEPEFTFTNSLTGGTNPSLAVTTTSQGGDTGRVQSATDPRGLVSKTDYDLLGRTLRTIQNFVAFAPSNSADQTTQYTYDGSNHILTLSAVLPGYALETTQYTYGVTGSTISSNDLLASVTYPPNGQTNTETYTYNALGQTLTKSARNGNTHTYSYDVLGRQTADAVTTLGANVDGTVRMLTTAFDSAGRPYLYTSYADTAGTTVVNQVKEVYDGLNNVTAEYQSQAGPVNGNTLKVGYTYSFDGNLNQPNNDRLTAIIYPNGNAATYTYNTGVDADISRISSISTDIFSESYTYLGLNTIVSRTRPLPASGDPSITTGPLVLSYILPGGGSTDGGDQYTGLDRFGRVVEQQWLNTNIGYGSGPTDDTHYTYDRDGNVLTRSQLHFATEQYNYDGLNQLTSFTRGTHTQSWNLDAMGNWSSLTTDRNTQTRSFNNQNQLTAISGATTPTYDNNGNTTLDDAGQRYVYDAWNRMVNVVMGSNTEFYTYDALGRRVTGQYNRNGQVSDLFYSKSWQLLYAGGTEELWAPDYVDDLVAQISSPTIGYYVQQDANWNVTAVVDPTYGIPDEHYTYDPYGKISYYDSSWHQLSSTAVGMGFFFQGGAYGMGLYYFRNRDYSPTLGRWMEQDPAGFETSGTNLYGFVVDNPVKSTDPTGKAIYVITGANDPTLPCTNIPNPINQALHQDVAVDKWVNVGGGQWLWLGKAYYTFEATGCGVWVGRDWLGLGKSFCCSWVTGTVDDVTLLRRQGAGNVVSLLQTTHEQDQEFKKFLDGLVGKQGAYSVARHNCRVFSQWAFQIATQMFPDAKAIYAK